MPLTALLERCAHVDQSVQVGVLWTHDFEISGTSDESPVVPPLLTEYVAPALAVACDEPAPVMEYMSSALVIEYVASARAVTLSVPSPLLPPAYTTTTDTTDDNFDTTGLGNPQSSITVVEACAPQVVGSLPPLDEFDALVAVMTTQHSVENPPVQEQVIVPITGVEVSAPQAVGSFSPLEGLMRPCTTKFIRN